MTEVVPVFDEAELARIGGILGTCRGIRLSVNGHNEAAMMTSQELLLAVVIFRLERIEQLLLEKRGR